MSDADAAEPGDRLAQWKGRLRGTWLNPRWIGVAYIDPALRRAGPHVRGTVVDVGCGTRPHQSQFAGQVDRWIGLDRPAPGGGARADVVADAMALPLRDGCADTVLATEVMEHLPRPGRLLEEAARVLRPGGALIVSSPFMEPLHEEPRDFFRFTPHGLRVLAEDHGFEVLSVEAKGGWWSVVLGSFANQALYAWANPEGPDGRRPDHPLVLALVLPLCGAAQVVGFLLDRLFRSRRYTLGYVMVARRRGPAGA